MTSEVRIQNSFTVNKEKTGSAGAECCRSNNYPLVLGETKARRPRSLVSRPSGMDFRYSVSPRCAMPTSAVCPCFAIKDWCENKCRYVVLFYKATQVEGEPRSSPEGQVWWEDIENLPNLKLSLDMNDMLRVFTEEDLSEFFYYQEGSEWKYALK